MDAPVENMNSLPFPPPLCPRQLCKPEIDGKGQNKNCCWLLRWSVYFTLSCENQWQLDIKKMKEEIFDWEIHGTPRAEIITIRTGCGRSFGEEITGRDSLQSETQHTQSPVCLGKTTPWDHQLSKHHPHPHPILLGPVGDPEPLTAQSPVAEHAMGSRSARDHAGVICVPWRWRQSSF